MSNSKQNGKQKMSTKQIVALVVAGVMIVTIIGAAIMSQIA